MVAGGGLGERSQQENDCRGRIVSRHRFPSGWDGRWSGTAVRKRACSGKRGSTLTVPAQSKIRALLVDDEDLARHVLRELLKSHPEVEIAGECANGFEAVKAVAEQRPNLIFLDVHMPKLTGFDALELIRTEVPVIFVTASDQHAMRAFDAHAVDYLTNPVRRERVE